MGWSSEQFYDNRLVAHELVASHLLRDLLPSSAGGISGGGARGANSQQQQSSSKETSEERKHGGNEVENEMNGIMAASSQQQEEQQPQTPWDDWADPRDPSSVWHAPVWVWDTAGCGLWDDSQGQASRRNLAAAASATGHDVSHSNPGEADLVVKHLEVLLSRLPEDQVAVITPYAGQVRLIRQRTAARWPGVEVGTVDGFQVRLRFDSVLPRCGWCLEIGAWTEWTPSSITKLLMLHALTIRFLENRIP